ncbi:MAG: hypB [Clostridia bacterium]|jgi:hydrogenase nickel incorporation protein HypB|nr:hypB [Clostridia bacterium]
MADNKKIEIFTNILQRNDQIAELTQMQMTEQGLLSINVMGAPGAGKTSVILSLIKEMTEMKAYVIEGDIESDIDTKKLREQGIETIQINTHGACHLDAPTLAAALQDLRPLQEGVIFIENIGNLVCPAEFQIGEHIKMLVVTVTEGSDKPYKYPLAFEKADIIILNKIDLLPYVDFDENYFMAGVRGLNPEVLVAKVTAKQNMGIKEVAKWIENKTTLISQELYL